MRVCDLCGKDIGDNFHRTRLGHSYVDFCMKCYKRYTDKETELIKKYDNEMKKWLKENGKNE